jgi:hypothetical protein
MYELIIISSIAAALFSIIQLRSAFARIEKLERRIAQLDEKERLEEGALVRALRDINAHNVIFRGLLRASPDTATLLKRFAEDYPLSDKDDLEVMKTVVSLTESWAHTE